MSKLMQDLKNLGTDKQGVTFLIDLIRAILACGGTVSLEHMADLVDRMIANNVNPFRKLDAQFTPEVLEAMVGLLDSLLPSTNGKHQPEQPKMGLEDGDTIKPCRPKSGKSRVSVARKNVIRCLLATRSRSVISPVRFTRWVWQFPTR